MSAAVTDLPEEERLRLRLRAMATVNHQLHEQLAAAVGQAPEGAAGVGANVRASAADPDESDPDAMGGSGDGLTSDKPYLTRRSDGVVFLIDAEGRRKVRSGMLAATLQLAYGPAGPEGDDAYGTKGDVPDMEILRGPHGDPFVVISGHRHTVKGLPVPRSITAAEAEAYPVGEPLDLGRSMMPKTARGSVGFEIKRALRGVKRRLRG